MRLLHVLLGGLGSLEIARGDGVLSLGNLRGDALGDDVLGTNVASLAGADGRLGSRRAHRAMPELDLAAELFDTLDVAPIALEPGNALCGSASQHPRRFPADAEPEVHRV